MDNSGSTKSKKSLVCSIFDTIPSTEKSTQHEGYSGSEVEKEDDESNALFDESKSAFLLQNTVSLKNRNLTKMQPPDPLKLRIQRRNDPDHKQYIKMLSTTAEGAGEILRSYGVAIIKFSQAPISTNATFSTDFLQTLSKRSEEIEREVCDRLDAKNIKWRVSIGNDTSALSSLDIEGKNYFKFQEVASRCLGRLDVRRGTNSYPFNDPQLTQNNTIVSIVKSLLGDDAKLQYCGLIYSMPNSADQPWHQDGAPLFDKFEIGNVDLPPYALNIFIPLQDVDEALGPTEFFPQSHVNKNASKINEDVEKASKRFPVIAPSLSFGDILLYDYRICHRGTQNLCINKTRAMLYLMYTRPWFVEHINFGEKFLFSNPDI